jgi:hypothetical protein
MSSPSSLDQNAAPLGVSDPSLDDRSSLLGREIPPMIRLAQAAFQRDLPLLINTHPHRWVAYHGHQRVAIGSSKRRLFQQCRGEGLLSGEFLVRLIEAEMPEEIDWNESRDI